MSLAFTVGSVCLCGVSSPVVVFGLFVRLSQYPMFVNVVVAVTVMHVLLFVLHVCVLRG